LGEKPSHPVPSLGFIALGERDPAPPKYSNRISSPMARTVSALARRFLAAVAGGSGDTPFLLRTACHLAELPLPGGAMLLIHPDIPLFIANDF